MKTLKPQLHIHINNNQKAIGVDSFKTPVEQTLQTPSNPPNLAPGGGFFPATGGDSALEGGFQTPYSGSGSRNASAVSIGIPKDIPAYQSDGMDLDDIERPFPLTKCSSISSMASSMMVETEPLVNNIEFEERFDMLLSEIYMGYSMNPETTPFNIRFPPGGVISMVSKDVFERCLKDKIPLDRNPAVNDELFFTREPSVVLSIIRKRLLDFCNRNMDADSQYSLSRQNSACSINFPQNSQQQVPYSAGSSLSSTTSSSSATQVPKMQRGKPSWLHSNLNTRPMSSTDSLVDSVSPQFYKNKKSNTGFTMVTPPSSSQGTGSYVEEFSFERKERSNAGSTTNNSSNTSGNANQGRVQPQVLMVPFNPPSSTSPQWSSPTLGGNPEGAPVLQSPFHEKSFNFGNNTMSTGTPKPPNTTRKSSLSNVISAGSVSTLKDPLELDLDPLYNVTSQRKRDSLKLKRNLR